MPPFHPSLKLHHFSLQIVQHHNKHYFSPSFIFLSLPHTFLTFANPNLRSHAFSSQEIAADLIHCQLKGKQWELNFGKLSHHFSPFNVVGLITKFSVIIFHLSRSGLRFSRDFSSSMVGFLIFHGHDSLYSQISHLSRSDLLLYSHHFFIYIIPFLSISFLFCQLNTLFLFIHTKKSKTLV